MGGYLYLVHYRIGFRSFGFIGVMKRARSSSRTITLWMLRAISSSADLMLPVASRARKRKITVNGLIQRETNTLGIRSTRNSQNMTQMQKTFMFVDDPEGAEKCSRQNPDALIIHRVTVHPPRCEHKPCKSPDCNCPEYYRLRRAEELGFHAPSPTVH